MATFTNYKWKNCTIFGVLTFILVNVTQFESSFVNAEYFSSVITLQKLTDVEKTLVQIFRDYLKERENEIKSYRRFIEDAETENDNGMEDLEDYLGNPVTAFKVIKRMAIDWTKLHENIIGSSAIREFEKQTEILREDQRTVGESELEGAVKGLLRLQKVYNTTAKDMAKGQINGVNIGAVLSSDECFEIGTKLFDQKQYTFSIPWLQFTLEMLNKTENKKDNNTESKVIDTLEYLALSNYELKNSLQAVEYINKILNISADHRIKSLLDIIEIIPPGQLPPLDPRDYKNFTQNYTRLCQGNQDPDQSLRYLKCTLESRGNSQFILAPLQIENLSTDPDIKVYHGILSDGQIDQILSEAKERPLLRSLTRNGVDPSHDRVSQQSWLFFESPIMKTIYRLVEEVTGLDMINAEPMQVADYGIGGQFEPHHDFISVNFKSPMWPGRRLSSNLFYFSNVEQGGFTVFPHLNIYTRPAKGSLLSWHNVHKSLDPDYRSLHAGCPVIVGLKKIGTIWIHAEHQEFRRPCDLERDDYKSQFYYVQT